MTIDDRFQLAQAKLHECSAQWRRSSEGSQVEELEAELALNAAHVECEEIRAESLRASIGAVDDRALKVALKHAEFWAGVYRERKDYVTSKIQRLHTAPP